MSRLLGPLSETISSVSWRDCARADTIAGMGSTLPAASPVIERRNWRRFITTSDVKPVHEASLSGFLACFSATLPQTPCHAALGAAKDCQQLESSGVSLTGVYRCRCRAGTVTGLCIQGRRSRPRNRHSVPLPCFHSAGTEAIALTDMG